MDHRFTTSKRFIQAYGIANVRPSEMNSRFLLKGRRKRSDAARDENDFMVLGRELKRDTSADQHGSTCKYDFHQILKLIVISDISVMTEMLTQKSLRTPAQALA